MIRSRLNHKGHKFRSGAKGRKFSHSRPAASPRHPIKSCEAATHSVALRKVEYSAWSELRQILSRRRPAIFPPRPLKISEREQYLIRNRSTEDISKVQK